MKHVDHLLEWNIVPLLGPNVTEDTIMAQTLRLEVNSHLFLFQHRAATMLSTIDASTYILSQVS